MVAIEITDDIQARIDKAQKALDSMAKSPDPFEGMSGEEMDDLHGIIIDSGDPKKFEQAIREWRENDNKIQREN